MKLFDKPLPRYVGITDFTDSDQAIKMQRHLARYTTGMKVPPVLMVGIMMNFETLWNIPNKWGSVFPLKERLDDIFPPYDTEGVLNTLHYADFHDPAGWPEEQNLFYSLAKALDYGRNNLHVIQLDMTWPDPGMIASAVHASRRVIQVILQIGRNALTDADHDPERVAEMIEDYVEVIDGVLLDQSMGEGKLMNSDLLADYIEAISKAHPQMHVAVAGGLDHRTLDVIIPLLEKFPRLSIDAQAGLRSSRNPKDPIEWRIAESYLERAASLFKQYER